MTIKGKADLYKSEMFVIHFDDAIHDVEVDIKEHFYTYENETLYMLSMINQGDFRGGNYDLPNSVYIDEILQGNSWATRMLKSPNPDLIYILCCVYSSDRKISCVKLIRFLTGCGLKEAKDFIDEYDKNPSLISEAADELQNDFREGILI